MDFSFFDLYVSQSKKKKKKLKNFYKKYKYYSKLIGYAFLYRAFKYLKSKHKGDLFL